MNRNTPPSAARPPTDPADSAIESLASARWTQEPDWPSLKEKLMLVRKSRFQFVRRRPILFTAIALTATAAVAAGAVRAYELYHFTGTMILDDGSTALVEGEMMVEGEQHTISINAEVPQGATSGGQMDITLPDGTTARVVAVPANGQTANPAPAQPK